MQKGKVIAYICFPLCFAWIVQTLIAFWGDVQIWKDPRTPGMFLMTAIIFLLIKNIPTLITLYFCTKAFDD